MNLSATLRRLFPSGCIEPDGKVKAPAGTPPQNCEVMVAGCEPGLPAGTPRQHFLVRANGHLLYLRIRPSRACARQQVAVVLAASRLADTEKAAVLEEDGRAYLAQECGACGA
jgi:hypothetical protein